MAFELGGQNTFRDALPAGQESLGFGLLGVGMVSVQGLGPLLAGPLADLSSPGLASGVLGFLVLAAAPVLWMPVRGLGVEH